MTIAIATVLEFIEQSEHDSLARELDDRDMIDSYFHSHPVSASAVVTEKEGEE